MFRVTEMLHRTTTDSRTASSTGRLAIIIRLFGGSQCEFALFVAAAIATFVGVLLQSYYGRAFSHWYVFRTVWFVGLFMLLEASLACAMCLRWPWRRRQTGMLITHAGALLVIAGFVLRLWSGVDGQITLTEGESTDQATRVDRCRISASWPDRPHEKPYVFTFESGPGDWNARSQLDLGVVDGMRARVLRYYQHAEVVETWRADERNVGGPLVRFQLNGPDGERVEHLLTDQDFGAELFVGSVALRLQRTGSEAMLTDFLNPPVHTLSEHGLLTMYYEDDVQRVAIGEHIGKSVPLGQSGVNVEIVHYLADAKLDRSGKFQPLKSEPRNPLVELLVHMPRENEPYRQVAFAKSPLLNFDGVYDRICPVKFVYEHPHIKPDTAVELLQDRQGKLFGRVMSDGKCRAKGEVSTGSRLDVSTGSTFCVTEYLPHARRGISFQPAKATGNASRPAPPATEIELSVAETTERIWLQRDVLQFRRQEMVTPEGRLLVEFDGAQLPLGFALELVDFIGESNRNRHASPPSVIRLIDTSARVDQQRQVSRSAPLKHNGFIVYPWGAEDTGHGRQAAIFRVVHDPGSLLRRIGIWLVLLGVAIALLLKTRGSIGLRQQWQQSWA